MEMLTGTERVFACEREAESADWARGRERVGGCRRDMLLAMRRRWETGRVDELCGGVGQVLVVVGVCDGCSKRYETSGCSDNYQLGLESRPTAQVEVSPGMRALIDIRQ